MLVEQGVGEGGFIQWGHTLEVEADNFVKKIMDIRIC